ncbi:hypothetical protein ACFX14_032465 [Malus domestica]
MSLPSQVEDDNTSLELHPVCHGGLKEVKVFNRVFIFSIELQAKLLLCLYLEASVEDPSCKRARPRSNQVSQLVVQPSTCLLP